MSIDEAISISINVQDLSLRLPERKIHDYRMTPYVLGIFEERPMHCDDPNITLAEISRSQRYGFYHRSVAALTAVAERSGPVKANSVEERYYLKEWDINDSAELYETISKSYERMGEVVAALEWMKRAVSRTEPGSASEGGKMGQLAYLAALAGDTESAESMRRQGNGSKASCRRASRDPIFIQVEQSTANS